jgi:hypothetical protein
MTLTIFQRVAKFNQDAGTKLGQETLNHKEWMNEIAMLQEELDELLVAGDIELAYQSRIETADALADIIYVAKGTMAKLVMDYERIMDEVCRSNESKYTDGKLVKNEAGKIQKGNSYSQPNLNFVSEPSRINLNSVSGGETNSPSSQEPKTNLSSSQRAAMSRISMEVQS